MEKLHQLGQELWARPEDDPLKGVLTWALRRANLCLETGCPVKITLAHIEKDGKCSLLDMNREHEATWRSDFENIDQYYNQPDSLAMAFAHVGTLTISGIPHPAVFIDLYEKHAQEMIRCAQRFNIKRKFFGIGKRIVDFSEPLIVVGSEDWEQPGQELSSR